MTGPAFEPLGLLDVSPAEMTRFALWWVGVHGGAGETALERLFQGSRATGHRWPLAAGCRPPVVLVARTDASGMRAAQGAMRDLLERALPVSVLGLVLMADTPGRLPRALRDLRRVIGGGVPRVWTLPFVQAWRVGEDPRRANSPIEAAQLRADLRAALAETQEDQ